MWKDVVTAYREQVKQATQLEQPALAVDRRRGPVGACPAAELVEHIRTQIHVSRFHGEGYRKIWAFLRFAGIRSAPGGSAVSWEQRPVGASSRRALPEENPRRHHRDRHGGHHVGDGHDRDRHRRRGLARVFVAVDHANSEVIGIHASRSGNRFEALEPIRQGVLRHFGTIGARAADGLKVRHDHGSNYMSQDFREELTFLGIVTSPSFVREPEGNGVAERFIRTLKENLLWVRTFDTIEDLRIALQDFARRYNKTWWLPDTDIEPPSRSGQCNSRVVNAQATNYPWQPE